MLGGNISGMLGADVKASYSVESVTHQVPGGATVPAPLLISLRNVVKDYDGLAGTVAVIGSGSVKTLCCAVFCSDLVGALDVGR